MTLFSKEGCKYPLITALGMLAAFFLIAFSLFSPVYATSDDLFMNLTVAGLCFTPSPSEYLIYSNIYLGKVLKSAYQVFPKTPWYGLYLISSHFLALSAILYTFLRKKETPYFKGFLFLIFLVITELFLFQHIQFTSTSLLCGIGGIFLVQAAIEKKALNYRLLIAGFGLLFLCALIRFHMLFICGVIAIPWIFAHLKTKRISFLISVFCFSFLIGLVQMGHYQAYKQNAWKNFYEWNNYKAAINDYNKITYTPKTKAQFDAIGWSKNDYDLFRYWFFLDEDLYGINSLKQLNVNESVPFQKRFQQLRRYVKHIPLHVGFLLFFYFILLGFVPRDKIPLLVIQFLFCLALAIGFILFLKFPLRISVPLFAFPVLCQIYCISVVPAFQKVIKSRMPHSGLVIFYIIAYSVLIVFSSLAVPAFSRHVKRNKKDLEKFNVSTQIYTALNPQKDELYATWSGAASFYNLVKPLNENRSITERFNTHCLGSLSNTPLQTSLVGKMNYTDIHKALLKENVYLISSENFNTKYLEYLRVHKGINARAELYYQDKEYELKVYQISL